MSDVIINDLGGLVGDHLIAGRILASAGANIIVVYCASACLNLLIEISPDKVCFRPDAWIGHHSSQQQPSGSESTTTMRWERGSDWIAAGWKACSKVTLLQVTK